MTSFLTDPLTTEEVAQMLRVEPVTIRRHCAAGKFPGARKPLGEWLIPQEDVDALLERAKPEPGVVLPERAPARRVAAERGFRALVGGKG